MQTFDRWRRFNIVYGLSYRGGVGGGARRTSGRVEKPTRGAAGGRGRSSRGGRGRGAGGRGRGRGEKKPAPSAEELDKELDSYRQAR